jgi:hypothetical protein
MKKFITVSLAAGLLAIGSSALLAEPSTNSPAGSPPTTTHTAKDPAKKALARRQLMEILGVTKSDFKGLAPADRIAKTKTLVDKKISELEAKQTAGSLTTKEQSDLAVLQKFAKRAHAKAKTDS